MDVNEFLGGLIMLCMRYEFLHTVPEYTKLIPYMGKLQDKGVWNMEDRIIHENYVAGKKGITFINRKN